ncbi:MAG: hypothetical protein BWY76_01495 [bacterium ADurb.Bin429]|nr:MAG: hypothetical protein BWY76_01495 [bacterium ADurb.Bin429]
MARAEGGREADYLAHHAGGGHHPHRAQRFVGNADIASRHEEVAEVVAVERAIGQPEGGGEGPLHAPGDELVAFETALVVAVRYVQVHVPGAGDAGVGKGGLLEQVAAGDDDVAEEAPRLALAGDIGGPGELVVRVQAVYVLQRVPGAVHGEEVAVADTFRIGDGMEVETALPEPVAQRTEAGFGPLRAPPAAAREGLVAQVHRPRAARKGRGSAGIANAPDVRRPHVAGERDIVLSAGMRAQVAVPGAVGEPTTRHPLAATGDDVLRDDPCHQAISRLRADKPVVHEQRQPRLGGEQRKARVIRRRGGIRATEQTGGRLQRADEITQPGERLQVRLAPHIHADFVAVIATDDRAVMHQRHGQPQARGGQRGGQAGDAATGHHQVKVTTVLRLHRQPPCRATEIGEVIRLIRRNEIEVGAEEQGVAASFKSR